MRRLQRAWLLVVVGGLIVVMVGCTKSRRVISLTYVGEKPGEPEYVVEQPDTIHIEVTNHPEISRTVQLRPDGKITLPLLGDVEVSGLTPLQIREQLIKLYSRYFKEVDITVTVTNFASKSVYLFREPGQARVLPYTGRQDFLETMARAGGPGSQAWMSHILLIRATPRTQEKEEVEKVEEIEVEIRKLDYKKVVRKGFLDEGHNPTIRDGDIIYIPMHPFHWFAWQIETLMRPIYAAFQPVRAVDTWTDVFSSD